MGKFLSMETRKNKPREIIRNLLRLIQAKNLILLKACFAYVDGILGRIVDIDSVPGENAAHKINGNRALQARELYADVVIRDGTVRERAVERMIDHCIILEANAVILKHTAFHTDHAAVQRHRADVPAGKRAAAHVDGCCGG